MEQLLLTILKMEPKIALTFFAATSLCWLMLQCHSSFHWTSVYRLLERQKHTQTQREWDTHTHTKLAQFSWRTGKKPKISHISAHDYDRNKYSNFHNSYQCNSSGARKAIWKISVYHYLKQYRVFITMHMHRHINAIFKTKRIFMSQSEGPHYFAIWSENEILKVAGSTRKI